MITMLRFESLFTIPENSYGLTIRLFVILVNSNICFIPNRDSVVLENAIMHPCLYWLVQRIIIHHD